jgi:transposase
MVMNTEGKMVMECVIETKANMILQCIDGLRGDLHVTFEEGTSAAWLYDLLKPHVTELIVYDPRKNASMREDNQNDKIDACRLAELLRIDHLNPVYHGEHGLRTLKELARSYLTVTLSNRANGAAGQNRSRSIKWAAKVENFRPREKCFFLTFAFIEQIRHNFRSYPLYGPDQIAEAVRA